MTVTSPGRLLTPDDLVTRIGHSADYWKRQARARKIPHSRFGQEVRFTEDDFARIVAAAAVKPADTDTGAAPAPSKPADPLRSLVQPRRGGAR